ncbi:Ribulose-phosphate 3-epimerase [Buchnera aphidicola (Eriosoma grossulariae)]|uniref:ribulose-phosphate 3-epimerase n=1 Tax=Buchnera aphidicola TaxID=9 RepID=UPI003464C309
MNQFLLAPSILSANFARLGEDVTRALTAGGDLIHFDVMDGHYVNNLTMGPMILKSLRDFNITAPIDVHLMTKPVDIFIPAFAQAGATFITFHPEATNHIDNTINLIKKFGCKAGLSFNPSTSLHYLDYVLDKLDLIVLMSVNPGFSNQKFISSVMNKIYQVRNLIDRSKFNVLLEVDGGIKISNIVDIASAGANIFVLGSVLFDSLDYKLVLNSIRSKLNSVFLSDCV